MDGTTIAILGAGRLGEALLSGLLRSGTVAPGDVWCTVRRAERARELGEVHGVRADTDSVGAAAWADVVLLGVKPQSLRGLLDDIAGSLRPTQTVVSLAAGARIETIEAAISTDVPVVRVMTNVAVQVDQAMSALAPGTHAGSTDLERAEAIMGHVGRVVHVAEESLDAVTALSGSGPAYLFLLAEAMIDGGILLGLPRDVSTELVIQTMVGAAAMLRDTGRHPVELRESVTSPGGTTISAVRVLESERVRAAFLSAIEAASQRAEELGG